MPKPGPNAGHELKYEEVLTMAKVTQHCPVCNTYCESYHEWDSLEEFYAADLDEPEFEHDEERSDCGGSLKYTISDKPADYIGRPWAAIKENKDIDWLGVYPLVSKQGFIEEIVGAADDDWKQRGIVYDEAEGCCRWASEYPELVEEDEY